MAESAIEWTDATWNPVTGCTKISAGCANCYAERMSRRLQAMGQPNYANGFSLTLHESALTRPLLWKRPRRIFVNSMSDLFHRDVPLEFIRRVFDVCERAHWHQFQILTKRAQRLARIASSLQWPANVWMGVSVESQEVVWRIDHLRSTPAAIRFVSFEPLIGPITEVDLSGIHWAIVGGESGPGARPSHPAWFHTLRHACDKQGTAFFFKQYGDFAPAKDWPDRLASIRLDLQGKVKELKADPAPTDADLVRVGKGKAGRMLDGRTFNAYPLSLT